MRGPEFILTQFSYDTLGRRISKTTYDYLNNSHTLIDTLSYVYAGKELLSQTKNGVTSLFISSFQDTDDILAKGENGNISYFHKDHLGSIVAITNNSGTIVSEYSYDAFGKVRNISGDADFENTLLYTGREYDKEIGLYFYRARYYDPELGRFISQDPIGIEDDINLYAYVGNNPVNFTDPSGEKSKGFFGDAAEVSPFYDVGGVIGGVFLGAYGIVTLNNELIKAGNDGVAQSLRNAINPVKKIKKVYKVYSVTNDKIKKIFSNEGRVHHAYRHLKDDFGNWNKINKQKFIDFSTNIIKNPDNVIKTLEKHGKEEIIRYSKKIGDYIYSIDVFSTGPNKGLIRTATKIVDKKN